MTRALDALTYPLRGTHRGDAVGATWVLFLAHGLVPVLPLVPVVGILLRVLGRSARGDDEAPPVVDGLPHLLRRSVGGSVLALAFVGPPLLYLVGVFQFVSSSGAVDGRTLPVLAAATVGGVATLVAAYLLPVALCGYATAGSFRTASDPARLRRGARSGRYLLGWLAGIVVVDAGSLLAAWIGRGTPIRAVAAGLVAAYALLVGVHVIGLGLAGSDVVAPPDTSSDENP